MASAPLTTERIRSEPPDDVAVPSPVQPAVSADSRNLTAGVLIFLTILYVILVAPLIARRLWFDELFTYYIARATTLPRLFDALAHTDLNPPLVYLLVRFFHGLFGTSELVTRLPVAVAFYLGSALAFVFLKRRVGVWWSAAAILLFWSTSYFRYATVARPYGLLIGFFGLTLISYDSSGRTRRRVWAGAGLAVGCVGMMLSHVFAPVSILPFCAAEMIRTIRQRRIDMAIWASLLAPVTIGLAYIPATRNFEHIYFPDIYQASGMQTLHFFTRLGLIYVLPWLPIAIGVACFAAPYSAKKPRNVPASGPAIAWMLALLAAPALLNILLIRTGGAFWERYCITSALAFYMMVGIALAWLTGFRRSSGLAAVLIFSIGAYLNGYASDSQTPKPAAMGSIRGDLPLVAASGLTFLELDSRYETGRTTVSLLLLLDRTAAMEEYTHSTIFENMSLLTQYFPIRSHVSSYDAFVSAHPHFLVLARADYLEPWVLQKLCDAGSRIRLVQSLSGQDRDFQLYDVQRGD